MNQQIKNILLSDNPERGIEEYVNEKVNYGIARAIIFFWLGVIIYALIQL